VRINDKNTRFTCDAIPALRPDITVITTGGSAPGRDLVLDAAIAAPR
jgi:hypothetical protein